MSSSSDLNAVASVFKRLLRELPETLLTNDNFDSFLDAKISRALLCSAWLANKFRNENVFCAAADAMAEVVKKLPPANREILAKVHFVFLVDWLIIVEIDV